MVWCVVVTWLAFVAVLVTLALRDPGPVSRRRRGAEDQGAFGLAMAGLIAMFLVCLGSEVLA